MLKLIELISAFNPFSIDEREYNTCDSQQFTSRKTNYRPI
jgi:hypothetical protein